MQRVGPLRAVLQAIIVVSASVSLYAPVHSVQAADETQRQTELLDDLRVSVQSLDRVRAHNEYLEGVIGDQQAARQSLGLQLENYRLTKPEIVPLMTQMIESLREFVELDLPFDLELRRARVHKLADNMSKSDIAIAEKFREILDAYRIEMDYGRDIDATVGWIEADGARREVTFLRVGRLTLLYQTHDRVETGFFNPVSREWEPLTDQYRDFVSEGLRIAKKQAAPVLLRLPVPGPGVEGAVD